MPIKTTKKFCALLLTACLLSALFSCNDNTQEQPQTDTAEITFTGLPEGDFTLTAAQLKSDYEITELEASTVKSDGEERLVHAKGVLLEAVLQKHGVSQKDFGAITTEGDGGESVYSITIQDDILHSRDILIAFEIDGEAIQPRVVIPGERAMYWTKFLSAIKFESQSKPKEVTKTLSLDEIIEKLKPRAENYKYYDSICKALPVALILDEIGAEKTEFVYLESLVGPLSKKERYSVFAAQLIVFEGTEDAPLFIGPDLAVGMRVKNIDSFQVGGILVKAD